MQTLQLDALYNYLLIQMRFSLILYFLFQAAFTLSTLQSSLFQTCDFNNTTKKFFKIYIDN